MNSPKNSYPPKFLPKKSKSEIICRCNNISRETIETAIIEGCDTMNKIYDTTTAGVGPCGGSCRRKIVPLLDEYLATGKFPEKTPSGARKKD